MHTLSHRHEHVDIVFYKQGIWADEQLRAEDWLYLIGLLDFPSLDLEIN